MTNEDDFKIAWENAQVLYNKMLGGFYPLPSETRMIVATQLFCAYRISEAVETATTHIRNVEHAVRSS